MDTGATRTVIGRQQAIAYSRRTAIPFSLSTGGRASYLFGGVTTPSLGKIDINIPLSPKLRVIMRVDVVGLDIPFLFGLDALDRLSLYVNNVENFLKCDKRGIAIPLTRKAGHIYLEWGVETFYTTAELERLHRHFNHPHPDRLVALLRRAGDPNAVPGTRAALERLSAACDVCQRVSRAPGRFRVALPPDDVVFNRVVLLDIMYLESRSVLHIVDKDTSFNAAAFTRGERLEQLWQLYLDTWVHPYAGHPQTMHVDQAPQFSSPVWRALVTSAGTDLVLSGVESHNALGAGERYHAFLRMVYRKVRASHAAVPQEAVLGMAVAAMNQTAGPRGLVPTLLVFGLIPRMPIAPLPLPTQQERMKAMEAARREMQALVAKARVRTALAAPVPAAANRDVNPGDDVLIYREPPVDQWVGPYTVVAQRDKTVWTAIDGSIKQFSIDKVKAYERMPPPNPAAPASTTRDPLATDNGRDVTAPRPVAEPGASQAGGPTAEVDRTESTSPHQAVDAPPTEETDASIDVDPSHRRELEAVIAGQTPPSPAGDTPQAFISTQSMAGVLHCSSQTGGRAARAPRGLGTATRPADKRPVGVLLRTPGSDANNDRVRRPPPSPDYITTVIPQGDPRLKTARYQAAAHKEVDGLNERGTFKRFKTRDVPAGANIIGGRFVFTLKHAGTAEEMPKARYVAQGHRDRAKALVVHNLATMRQRSTRLLVSTAAVLGLRLFAHDITQAYLQSQDRFTRQLYLRPRPQDRHLFDLAEDEILRIELPLYGVCDAGDYWNATLTAYIEKDLKMAPLTSDPALYYKRGPDGKLSGLLGAYVDDCLMAGGATFQAATTSMLVKFQGKKRVWDNTEFVGVRVTTARGESPYFTLDQVAYVDHLHALPGAAPFSKFSSARASVAWLGHTRPDLCCGINQMAQVTEQAYDRAAVRALNALIKKAKAGRDVVLTYPKLDRSTLRLRVYADSAFANNKDQSSQMGYVVLLCDGTGQAHVLSYVSRKCKRVVRSIMAGEVYAFSTAFDEAYVIRYDLEQLYGCHVPLVMFTDSKQLFDVVTKASHSSEKRLMIDIAAAREAYNRHDITSVGLIASEHNLSDAMTKLRCGPALDSFLRTGVVHTPVVQWIVRTPVDPRCSTTGDRAL